MGGGGGRRGRQEGGGGTYIRSCVHMKGAEGII